MSPAELVIVPAIAGSATGLVVAVRVGCIFKDANPGPGEFWNRIIFIC